MHFSLFKSISKVSTQRNPVASYVKSLKKRILFYSGCTQQKTKTINARFRIFNTMIPDCFSLPSPSPSTKNKAKTLKINEKAILGRWRSRFLIARKWIAFGCQIIGKWVWEVLRWLQMGGRALRQEGPVWQVRQIYGTGGPEIIEMGSPEMKIREGLFEFFKNCHRTERWHLEFCTFSAEQKTGISSICTHVSTRTITQSS